MIVCLQCARHIREDAQSCPFCGARPHGTITAAAVAVALGIVLGGCSPAVSVDDGTSTGMVATSTSTSTTTSGMSSSSTTAPGTTDATTSPGTTPPGDTSTSTTTGNDDDDDVGCAFYGCACCDFGETPAFECDVWAQDCPEGEKCMPWANDGGLDWNGTRCSPLDASPAAVGDVCTVEGSGQSGIDNCDLGTMCWNVDPDTNMGTCADMCEGSEAAPVCPDPSTMCVVAYGGAIALCLRTCDPDKPMCADGESCVALRGAFVCAPS